MADEDTKVDGDQINGSQIEDTNGNDQDGNEDVDITKQSDGEFMEETVGFIKDTQKAILDEDDSDVTSDSDTDDSRIIPELRGTDIPDAFSDAAEAAGMSKDDIIAFADKHTDEELMDKIPELEAALENADENKETKDKEDTKQDGKINKDDDTKTEEIDPKLIEKISKQLEEKFGTTLEEINKFKANQEEQSNKQTLDRASKILDEASKEFPVFGKTDELPKWPSGRLKGQLIQTSPEVKARLEVLRYADAFISQGADIDNAMANALATYKGLHLEKELERKQIRDLKNHEQKLSGARVGRETKKKHADTRDEIIDDIKQMQREAGVD